MSWESWKKEFYPKQAHRVSKKNALGHSLKKWEGYLKKNLKKHKVTWNEVRHEVGGGRITCALCNHYIDPPSCPACPLSLSGDCCIESYDSRYNRTCRTDDARFIVNALRKAKRYVEKKK